MAKQGLIRIPFYPQLNCLAQIDVHAPLVMSALLFWMSRNQTAATFCEKRHNYQLALHLGLSYPKLNECLEKLHAQQLFIKHKVIVKPKEYTQEAKEKEEIYLSLNFTRLYELLQSLGCHIELKHLLHAADDNFDFYDVIDLKLIPLVQSLHGCLNKKEYLEACLEVCRFLIYVNEHCENVANIAIAPGWKLLLTVPMGISEEEYAQQLVVRFTREQEMAIDFNFVDGNLFLPCYDEIQSKIHSVKHYRKHIPSMNLAAALMLHLQQHFDQYLYFTSELSVDKLTTAFLLCYEINGQVPELREEYYQARLLNEQDLQAEKERYRTLSAKIIADATQKHSS